MPTIQTVNKSISTLFTFTPRQVLLGSSTMKHNNDDKTTCNGAVGLKPEQKVLLHKSIAHYLELSGFKKTLKKFCSEAQIEKDNLEGLVIGLEEMCLKYLDICKEDKAKTNNQKEQGEHLKKDGDENLIADTENAGKKKKKRSDKSDNKAVVHQTETDSKNSEEKEKKKKRSDKSDNEAVHQSGTDSKNSEEKDNDNQCKEKKKKKSKLASESPSNNTEVKLKDDVSADAKTVIGAETEKKSKDKKKKKHKPGYDSTVSEKDSLKTSKEALTEKGSKDSKKRKRLASEENDTQLADSKGDEESKRRKLEDLNESDGGKQLAQINGNLGSNLNADKENVGENGHVGSDQLQKSSGGKLNGDLEKTGEKFSVPRSQKKQQKGSVEKKEVKAFQRVKLDEVVYADERLHDNSYWAKDGAESGYGAKAEEVLGQVRGRDFRHEKTKKKRGSYRGGQIDLQSHSVKFNYSDDE